MRYQYTHDADNRTVYKFPAEPTVTEQRWGPSKKLVGWSVSMELKITRADNRLENRRWKYAHTEYPREVFDAPRYSRQEAISFFFQNCSPPGEMITEEEYVRLQAEYDASTGEEARQQR
ncbi:hypothetical protein [uncultured Zoogloea sp.]|uniref:hypothetical protein n=1 Tax=uncultured Zoogloea sp. TaxID=160237 RepID=UPI0026370BBD|nr:hypothetical protein [uncultured Zoogloea sp.]